MSPVEVEDVLRAHPDVVLVVSSYMEAAMRLTPESLYLEGRKSFFQGRGLLFDKQYNTAANLLEQSVRIDPGMFQPFDEFPHRAIERRGDTCLLAPFHNRSIHKIDFGLPLGQNVLKH